MNFIFSKRLKEFPDLSTATNLQKLDLSYCSSLVVLPYSIGNAINLNKLNLRYCSSLVELPSSIGNIVNLQELCLLDCSSLVELPYSMSNLGRLSNLELSNCSKLEVNLANINLESLEYLHLSGCSLLKSYHESSTDIQETDPWTGRISRLQSLYLSRMKNLVSLPPLPDSVVELDSSYCESLERLDGSFRNPDIRLNFVNCFKLNQQARDLIIHMPTNEFAILPAEEVPQCFTYRSSGSSLTVKLNQKPLGTLTKFKACILVADEDVEYSFLGSVCCTIKSGGNAFIAFNRRIATLLQGNLFTFEVEYETEEVTSTELVYDFEHVLDTKTLKIQECGILQLLEVLPLLSLEDNVEDDDEGYESSETEI